MRWCRFAWLQARPMYYPCFQWFFVSCVH
jgi:hypothetical protein